MHKKGLFAVTSFVIDLSAIACFPTLSMAKATRIDAVKLYNKHCNACHDKNGKPTDFGKELVTTDFTDKDWQANTTDEKIVKQITEGAPEKMMPFKGKLSVDEIAALVPVIRNFAKK
ncbi:MAG: c-type cytochrome [Candidatus Brocadia sp.]